MGRSTFNILFYANKGKEKNGIVPIMGRVTINGTQSQFSCKMSIPLTMWDVKGNCAKGRTKTERLRGTEKTKYEIYHAVGTGLLKGRTKTERLRGTEKTKYEIYHAVGTGLLRCKSWPEFVNHLKANGVEVELVMRRNASKDLKDLQGMRFKKDGYTFKASQIRRGLSYAAILSKLDSNAEKEQQRTINSQARLIQAEQPREETYSEPQKHNEPSIGIPSLGLFDTTNPVYDPAEEEFRRRMQKKKKKRGPRL